LVKKVHRGWKDEG